MASVMSSSTMNTIHLGEIQDNDDDRTSNLDNVDGIKYSDASLSTAEQVDTLRTGNNNRLAFLPVRTASMGSSKGSGSVYSRSSKISVRRRDVIKPVAIALPPPPAADDINENESDRIAVLVPSNNNQEAAAETIKASSMQWTMMPSNPQAGCGDNNNELAMVVHGQPLRGMEPPETSKASYGCDPPEYDDNDNDTNNNSIVYRNRYKHISWVDPKSISQNDIDYDTLRKYRQLSGNDIHSSHYGNNNDNYYYNNTVDTNQQRVRIATISSGYKTARFFVREDLDQRIYFHELEDAVSYMARRGYARMEKGMEKEWMGLLKKAHEVVKVGRTKKKQRYRKGKLVLIMYKPIKDETVDHYSDVPKNKSSSNDNESVTSDAETAHTSLGRSIRCGYKSYSEKFIAQHMNGGGGVLLLTNGTTNSSNYNNAASASSSGLLQITNGTTSSSSNNNNMSYIQEEGEEGSETTPASEKKRGVYGGGVRYFTPDKSYSEDGDEGSDDEEDDQEDNASQESEEEEEDNKSASDDYLEVEGSDMGSFLSDEEDDTYNRPSSGVSSVVDEEENSTINSEMSSIDRNANSGTGVYMAKNQGNVGMGNTLNKKRAPTPFDKSPGMVSISSESDSEA